MSNDNDLPLSRRMGIRVSAKLRSLNARDAVLAFLLSLSFYSTFEGLRGFAEANGGAISLGSYPIVLSAVFIITGGLGYCGHVAISANPEVSTRARIINGLGYLFFGLVALHFAFAFWWASFGARSSTNAGVATAVTSIERSLKRTQAQLRTANDGLLSEARRAGDLALTEQKSGGTCGDGNVTKTAGPRFRLRQRNAQLFGSMAGSLGGKISSLNVDVAASLARVGELRKSAASANPQTRIARLEAARSALVELGDKVDVLRRDPVLQGQAAELIRMAPTYRTPNAQIDPETGSFTCLDEATAIAATGIGKSLSAIESLPRADFPIFEGNQATIEAMRRLSSSLFGAFNPGLGGGLSGTNDYVSLILTLMVDGLIPIVSRTRGGNHRSSDPVTAADREITARRRSREARRRLIADDADVLSDANSTLAKAMPWAIELLVDWQGRRYLVIPQFVPNEAMRQQANVLLWKLFSLSANKSSGIQEQISRSKRRRFLPSRWDRKAIIAMGESSLWATSSQFRWFDISDVGLETLATYAEASGSFADAGTENEGSGHMARAKKARTSMRVQAVQHKADAAEQALAHRIAEDAADLRARDVAHTAYIRQQYTDHSSEPETTPREYPENITRSDGEPMWKSNGTKTQTSKGCLMDDDMKEGSTERPQGNPRHDVSALVKLQ